MKIILALALTLCLFACKEKEEAAIYPDIVGTYQKTYTTTIRGVFQDILSDYNNCQETATLVVTQASSNGYNLQVALTGVAKKGILTTNYGFTTKMTPHRPNNIGNVMLFSGTYENLTPNSPKFSAGKQTYAEIKYSGGDVEILLIANYEEDQFPLLYAVLPKIK